MASNCLWCRGAGCDVCTPRDLPRWFRGGTATQRERVALGLHPMGRQLLAGRAETCGSCAHLQRNQWDKVYLKCALAQNTHGPATDIRAKWAACVEWKPAAGQVQPC